MAKAARKKARKHQWCEPLWDLCPTIPDANCRKRKTCSFASGLRLGPIRGGGGAFVRAPAIA